MDVSISQPTFSSIRVSSDGDGISYLTKINMHWDKEDTFHVYMGLDPWGSGDKDESMF